MQPQPGISPLGRTGEARVDDVESGPAMAPLQYVMEEDRVRFTGVRAPQEDDVRFLDFPV
jgi:hypothetical protein